MGDRDGSLQPLSSLQRIPDASGKPVPPEDMGGCVSRGDSEAKMPEPAVSLEGGSGRLAWNLGRVLASEQGLGREQAQLHPGVRKAAICPLMLPVVPALALGHCEPCPRGDLSR